MPSYESSARLFGHLLHGFRNASVTSECAGVWKRYVMGDHNKNLITNLCGLFHFPALTSNARSVLSMSIFTPQEGIEKL
jgi:hypothetical protein